MKIGFISIPNSTQTSGNPQPTFDNNGVTFRVTPLSMSVHPAAGSRSSLTEATVTRSSFRAYLSTYVQTVIQSFSPSVLLESETGSQPVSLDGDGKSCCFKCAGIFYGSCLALHALPVPAALATTYNFNQCLCHSLSASAFAAASPSRAK